MDWANERWCRLYKRDTTTWKLLPWQGKAVLPLLMRKLDLSGRLDFDLSECSAAEAVSLHTELPPEVAEVGWSACLAKGIFLVDDLGILMPNYVPANETPASDKQRAKEHRERTKLERAEPRPSRNVTDAEQNVTDESRNVPEPSRAVTPRHAASHRVTPRHSDTSDLETSDTAETLGEGADAPQATRQKRRARYAPESWAPTDAHRSLASTLRVDLQGEVAKFRDHEFQSPKSDWDRAFSNWLRRAGEGAGRGGSRPRAIGPAKALTAAEFDASGDDFKGIV